METPYASLWFRVLESPPVSERLFYKRAVKGKGEEVSIGAVRGAHFGFNLVKKLMRVEIGGMNKGN